LDFVDITMPLGQDEVLPVLKHREVVSSSAPASSAQTAEAEGSGKKSKKDKKEKKEKSPDKASKKDKEGKKEKKGGGGAVVDLLSLDAWGSPAAPASAPAPAPAPGPGADKADKKKSKEASKQAWSLLCADRGVTVSYSVAATGSTALAISFRVSNGSGFRCSVEASLSSAGGVAVPAGTTIKICSLLAVGGEAVGVAPASTTGPLVATCTVSLPCSARVAVEGLSGLEQRASDHHVSVSLCAGCVPNKIDADGFAALLAKKAGQWGSSKVKVPVPAGAKAKAALKAVGLFLRAHCVEEEVTKAASFASKTPAGGGGSICSLAKCSKDGSQVGVEVKVLCSSGKGESQAVAEAVCAALAAATLVL